MKKNPRNIRPMLLAVLLLASLAGRAPADDGADLTDIQKVDRALNMSVKIYGGIYSYSAIIVIQERIDGTLREKEYIKTVFAKPRRVFLEWIKPYEGMKAAYLPERDGKDKFQIMESGFRGIFGVFHWTNDSVIIDSFYPHRFRPYQTNLSYMFDLALKTWNRANTIGKVHVREIAPINDPALGRASIKMDVDFSPDPADGMMFGRVTFYVDKKTGLPLHFDLYDHDGGLWGYYAFTTFEPNIKVDGAIFDLNNQ